ncbi:hypothetical protein BG000_002926 [Podila horticola]|nr:hypothetical protein BG000_002926 [Podila horticola]
MSSSSIPLVATEAHPYMSSSTEPTSCPLSNPSFFFGSRFSLNEPYYLFNFDINPNTSVFSVTFLTALVLQITGFYLLKTYVPSLSRQSRKDRRGLSWVLTFFSSIILFTGTFTLSTNMEWQGGRPNGSPSIVSQQHDSKFLLLSLRNFPQESDVAVAYSAYFVSYLICDLVLGVIHYRAYLDPLSGWFHHLGYLGVVSNATLQRNVSTLFAIGTPIEAAGHIFPHLRNDILFATSFFLARIVYPIIMLPELYLNVEARLCWKVAVLALLVHIHWFHKFVQQQVRYYHSRQLKRQQNEQVKPLRMQIKKDEVKSGLVQEYPLVHKTTDRGHKRASFEANDVAMTGVPNAIEFNGSRRRRTGPYTSATPSDYDSPMPRIILPVLNQDYDFDAPLARNAPKTFSAVAHRRSDSQKASAISAMGLSRASSMRDSKKRISLSAIQFEEPKKIQPRRTTTTVENREGEEDVDGSTTVVQRRLVVRNEDDVSVPRRHVANVFDTVRARGVSVNA